MKKKLVILIFLGMVIFPLFGSICTPLEHRYDRRVRDYLIALDIYEPGHPIVESLEYELAGLFNALAQCWFDYPIP